MSAGDLLFRMFRYQVWANEEMVRAMQGLDTEGYAEARHTALRLMNHCLVVNKIFAAHLAGQPHGFAADNTPETPTLQALSAELATVDQWYLDYVRKVTPAMLAESIPFTFTDGDLGYMTREEMLMHVVTHGGYHRGEVGRVMRQVSASAGPDFQLPWDTYAVHLHRTEPARRLQGAEAPAVL